MTFILAKFGITTLQKTNKRGNKSHLQSNHLDVLCHRLLLTLGNLEVYFFNFFMMSNISYGLFWEASKNMILTVYEVFFLSYLCFEDGYFFLKIGFLDPGLFFDLKKLKT